MSEDLGFKITGDTSPIQRKMDQLTPHFEAAGKKLSNRFKLSFAAGLAGLTSLVILAVGRAIGEAMTDASEAAREAAKTGIGVEDFQTLKRIADESGASVEKLVETLKEGGAAAVRLREQMEASNKAFGGTQSEETVGQLTLLSDVLETAWNKFKQIAGVLTGVVTEKLGILAGGLVGAAEGVINVFKEGRLGAFTDAIGERVGSAMAGGDTVLTRRKVEAGEAKIAEKRRENRKEEAVAGKALAKKKAEDLAKAQNQVLVKSPQADALSQVGLFTGRAAFERSQYEQQSLSYLETIARNTGATGASGPPQVAT